MDALLLTKFQQLVVSEVGVRLYLQSTVKIRKNVIDICDLRQCY